MATAWLFHDSLVRQALLSRQHSCYRVNLCHLIGLIITFHQRYWSVSSLLKGKGEKRRGDQNVSGKQERGEKKFKKNDICVVSRGSGQCVPSLLAVLHPCIHLPRCRGYWWRWNVSHDVALLAPHQTAAVTQYGHAYNCSAKDTMWINKQYF